MLKFEKKIRRQKVKTHQTCKFFLVPLTLFLHWSAQSRSCSVCLSVERTKFPLFLNVGWSSWLQVNQHIFYILYFAEPVSESNHEIIHYSSEYQLRHSVWNSDKRQSHFITRLITNAMKDAYKLCNYDWNLNRWKRILCFAGDWDWLINTLANTLLVLW